MRLGNHEMSALEIPLRRWWSILMKVYGRLGRLHIALLAAGIAFYGLLSIFPSITAAVALVGMVYDPAMLVDQSEWLVDTLPAAAGDLIIGQLDQVSSAGSQSLSRAALISLVIALWSASKGMGSFTQGLNVIYNQTEERGFIVTKLLNIGLTIGLILGMSLSLTIVAAIPALLAFFGSFPLLTEISLILRWPVMFMIGVFGIATLYHLGPDRGPRTFRWMTPGALLSCGLWVTGTFGFSYYVQSFGSYNETFGTLAGVIILLTWLWLSAYVVLLGAQLDAEIENEMANLTQSASNGDQNVAQLATANSALDSEV